MRMIAMLAASAALTCMSLAPLPAMAEGETADETYPKRMDSELTIGTYKVTISELESEEFQPIYVAQTPLAGTMSGTGDTALEALKELAGVVIALGHVKANDTADPMRELYLGGRRVGSIVSSAEGEEGKDYVLKLLGFEGVSFIVPAAIYQKYGYEAGDMVLMTVVAGDEPNERMVLGFTEDEEESEGFSPGH